MAVIWLRMTDWTAQMISGDPSSLQSLLQKFLSDTTSWFEKPCELLLPSLHTHYIDRKTLIHRSLGILYPLLAWAITFTVALTILLSLGFGPAGIIAGTAIYPCTSKIV